MTASTRRLAQLAAVLVISFAGLGSVKAQEYTTAQRIACTPDAWRLCSGSMPFIADVKACMIANKKNLSPSCRAQFPKEVATR